MEENSVVTMPTEQEVNINDTPSSTDTKGLQESQQTTDNTSQQESDKPSFKVKHLHEEKVIGYDEAPTYIQKGLDYDRVKSKYEDSKPVISFVERLAKQNNMSVPEYLQAVEEYERNQEIESLASQSNIDTELAEELYLLREERKQRETQKQQYERESMEKQEYIDFLNEFPEIKSPEDVPKEVWEIKRKHPSISMTDAYIRHERNQLKAKLSATETNQKNASSSTGSLTGNGNATGDFISYETFEKNKGNREWIVKNLTKITNSRSKW